MKSKRMKRQTTNSKVSRDDRAASRKNSLSSLSTGALTRGSEPWADMEWKAKVTVCLLLQSAATRKCSFHFSLASIWNYAGFSLFLRTFAFLFRLLIKSAIIYVHKENSFTFRPTLCFSLTYRFPSFLHPQLYVTVAFRRELVISAAHRLPTNSLSWAVINRTPASSWQTFASWTR